MEDEKVGRVTTGDLIRQLVLAHVKADDRRFELAVQELIAEEKRKNHPVFAKELERILRSANSRAARSPESLSLFPTGEIPRDKSRALDLVEIVEPRRTLEELILPLETRSEIERIIDENRRAEVLHSRGLNPAKKILFCGPPGCGKTATAEAISAALYLPLAIVRFDSIISSYLGETAANLRRVFDFAIGTPIVLLFDEFDAIGKRRDDREEHGELKRVVSSFLQILDRFKADSLVIAATNHEQLLDSAIWRRFDAVTLFPRPTAEEIEELLVRWWRQVRLSSSIHVTELAHSLIGLSHADVERIAIDVLKELVLSRAETIDLAMIEASIARERERLTLSSGLRASTTDERHLRKPGSRQLRKK